jgi:hypothetical protein
MPKKDTASAVVGMLSSVGSQTRPAINRAEPVRPPLVTAPTVTVTEEVQASVSPLPTAGQAVRAPESLPAAPRTLRLRSTAAQRLRDAWLEAKRDDVLLTAQDFASDLVEEALARRQQLQDVTL